MSKHKHKYSILIYEEQGTLFNEEEKTLVFENDYYFSE